MKKYSIRSICVLTILIAIVLGVVVHLQKLRKQKQEKQLKAIEMLENCPNIYLPAEFDAIQVVATVNYLRSLGHNDSVEALEAFLEKYPYDKDYFSPHQILQLIIPLLYTPANPEAPIIKYDEFSKSNVRLRGDWGYKEWVIVEQDIPFRIGPSSFGFSGTPFDHSYLVEWAKNHTYLRKSDLVPADNPFDAAASLFVYLESLGHVDLDLESRLYLQSYNMIEELFAAKQSEVESESGNSISMSEERTMWEELRKECKANGIYWNKSKQRYEFTK